MGILFKIPGEGEDFRPSLLLRFVWYTSDALFLLVMILSLIWLVVEI